MVPILYWHHWGWSKRSSGRNLKSISSTREKDLIQGPLTTQSKGKLGLHGLDEPWGEPSFIGNDSTMGSLHIYSAWAWRSQEMLWKMDTRTLSRKRCPATSILYTNQAPVLCFPKKGSSSGRTPAPAADKAKFLDDSARATALPTLAEGGLFSVRWNRGVLWVGNPKHSQKA